MGKMFTAVAVINLVERGLLDYQQKVGGILPNYPNEAVKNEVSIHQLLTHTSGMGSYFNDSFDKANKDEIRELTDYLDFFKDEKLAFKPGERFRYSNADYVVLGLIIEKVTGTNYYDFIHQSLFLPLGMNNTGWNEKGERGSPAGGGYSTIADIYNFAKAIQSNTVISETSKQLMLKGSTANPEYGYGFSKKVFNGHSIYGHNGDAPDVAVEMDIYLDSGLIVITLSNRSPYDGWAELRSFIRQQFVGDTPANVSFLNAEKIINTYQKSGYKTALQLLIQLNKEISKSNILYQAEKYIDKKLYTQAHELTQLVLSVYPEDWYVNSFLADIYLLQGNKIQAKTYFKKSLELNSGNQHAKEELKKLL